MRVYVCDGVRVSVLLPLCMYVRLSVCFYLLTFDWVYVCYLMFIESVYSVFSILCAAFWRNKRWWIKRYINSQWQPSTTVSTNELCHYCGLRWPSMSQANVFLVASGACLTAMLLMLLLWAAEKMDSAQTRLLFEASVIASPRFFTQPGLVAYCNGCKKASIWRNSSRFLYAIWPSRLQKAHAKSG